MYGPEAGDHKDQQEGQKNTHIYYFQIAELLGAKDASGGPIQCKFSADECFSRHIASLKEITRSEARSTLAEARNGAVKRAAEIALQAAKGTYKDE